MIDNTTASPYLTYGCNLTLVNKNEITIPFSDPKW